MESREEARRLRGCDDERSFPPECFRRSDESDDALFYDSPRKVVHLDGAMCAVSVQYLTHPTCVFREVHRVLSPGAPFIVTFSNSCFAQKAVALWRATDDRQHLDLVTTYFRLSGGWADLVGEDRSPDAGSGDPLFLAVWVRKAKAAGD